MNLLSKVILLLLSLIILIISCVYNHVEELENKNPIFDIPNKLENFIKNELFIENENTDNLEENFKKTKEPLSNILDENESIEKFNVLEDVKQEDKIEANLNLQNNVEIISKKENVDIKINPLKIEDKIIKKDNLENIDKVNKLEKKDVSDKKYIKVLLKTKLLKEDKVESKEVVSSPIAKDESFSKNSNLLIQKEINEEIKKQRIIFKIKSFKLSNKSYILIKKIALILKKNKDIRIEVAGHTDAKGDEKVNQYYSFNRAKIVKKELVKYGINKSRIVAKGYGESKPLVKNDPQGYSKINRRVEFNIIEE